MNKKFGMIVCIIIGVVIVLVLLHLGANWLIPMVQKMHSGAGA